MKVLLTGGSGFIGRHLLEALRTQHEVFAPTHSQLDITDSAEVDRVLRQHKYDAALHAAIQGGPAVLDSTLRGFWNLARNAEQLDRVIYFGSGAEYGKHRDLIKVSEREIGKEVPRDPYGFAKLVCNSMCRRSSNVLNLRLFGVYGPYEGYTTKFISNAVAKTLLGIPVVIRQNVVFDYLWIDDLVRIVSHFLTGERTAGDLNTTPTDSASLTAIAALVLREAGRNAGNFKTELPGLNFQYTGDNAELLQRCPGLTGPLALEHRLG